MITMHTVMGLVTVSAYEIRDIMKYVCLSDHVNGLKLLQILYYRFT